MKLSQIMALHMSAFMAKSLAFNGAYEKRSEPSIANVAESIDKINVAFDEYKKANDARIEAVKAGNSTSDLDAKLEKINAEMTGLSELKTKLELIETKLSRPSAFEARRLDNESKEEAEYRNAFLGWMRSPKDMGRQQKAAEAAKALEAKRNHDDFETRAVQTTTLTGAAGGFGLPKNIEAAISAIGLDVSPIRQLATVRQVGTTDYNELIDINGAGFEWAGETGARSQTNTDDLFNIKPTFGTASARPQASEESLDDLFFNVEQWLIDSARLAINVGEGASFVSGTGVNRPTGMLSGPAPLATGDNVRAFGTLQYIAGGVAAAMPTNLDPFVQMVYAVRARYRANASWVTSKAILAALRSYKDTTGQYLWQPAVMAGQPDTFMGYPIYEAEDMPAVAANAFPLAFGDFREGYLIADRVGLRVTRDDITQPGFVKFYVRKRVGGILRNTQAIKLLRISTT